VSVMQIGPAGKGRAPGKGIAEQVAARIAPRSRGQREIAAGKMPLYSPPQSAARGRAEVGAGMGNCASINRASETGNAAAKNQPMSDDKRSDADLQA